jgi:hypothetical protein
MGSAAYKISSSHVIYSYQTLADLLQSLAWWPSVLWQATRYIESIGEQNERKSKKVQQIVRWIVIIKSRLSFPVG